MPTWAARPVRTVPPSQEPTEQVPATARRPVGQPRQRERPGQHVWVRTGDGWLPGLLLQWRREPAGETPRDADRDRRAGGHRGGGWAGLVAYPADVDGRPALIQTWLPADQLRPTGGR